MTFPKPLTIVFAGFLERVIPSKNFHALGTIHSESNFFDEQRLFANDVMTLELLVDRGEAFASVGASRDQLFELRLLLKLLGVDGVTESNDDRLADIFLEHYAPIVAALGDDGIATEYKAALRRNVKAP